MSSNKRFFFVSVETTGTGAIYAGDYAIEIDKYPNRAELVENIIQSLYESKNIPEGTPIDMVFRNISELKQEDYEEWTGKKIPKPKKKKIKIEEVTEPKNEESHSNP